MSTIIATTLGNGSKSVPVEAVAEGTPRAWVNVDQVGTMTIKDSYNVASITDNGVGSTTATFTVAFANANYAVVGCGGSDNVSNNCYLVSGNQPAGSKAVTSCRIVLLNAAGTVADSIEPCAAFLGL
jgi:hypothetical protein